MLPTTLGPLVAQRADDEFELVVVCNACTDGTQEAAAALGDVIVVTTPVASKTHALNLGDAAVGAFPRCYLDADVRISLDALRALVAVVQDGSGCLVAVPAGTFNLAGRGWAVKAFYRVWTALPFYTAGLATNGVYVLSRAGRARLGAFPDVLADDHWVLSQFSADERRTVADAVVVVETPTSLKDLVRIKSRGFLGERQLTATTVRATGAPLDIRQHGSRWAWLRVSASRPSLWLPAVVYVGVNLVAEIRARRRLARGDFGWERDLSSRTAAARSVQP